MIDRIVEITNPAELSVQHAQLVIAPESTQPCTSSISEMAVGAIAHPSVKLTQAVLSRIAVNGDRYHMRGHVLARLHAASAPIGCRGLEPEEADEAGTASAETPRHSRWGPGSPRPDHG